MFCIKEFWWVKTGIFWLVSWFGFFGGGGGCCFGGFLCGFLFGGWRGPHFLDRQNFLYCFRHIATVPKGLMPILGLSLLSLSLQVILPGQCQLELAIRWPKAADRRCPASTDCLLPLPCPPGVRKSQRFWGCLHCPVAVCCGQCTAAWPILWAVRWATLENQR